MPAVRPLFFLLFFLLCVLPIASRASAQCLGIPLDHPLLSGSLTLGSGSVNDGTTTSPVTGSGSDIQLNGMRTDLLVNYPALNPSAFPSFTGSDSTANPLPAGTYGTVTPATTGSGGRTHTLSGGSSTTFIRTLNHGNREIVFNAGTYFIETWNITGRKPSIVANGGLVRIYVGQVVDMSASSGPNIRFNQNGIVGDFQLFLYPKARFVGRDRTHFRGLLYSPGDASVSIGPNSRIGGVIATSGAVSIGDNAAFTLTPDMKTELVGLTGCAKASRFLITAAAEAATCGAHPVSITALDSQGNTVIYYMGRIDLGTSTGRGDWSGGSPAPQGTLAPGAANTGKASYTFARGDRGVVNLGLANRNAETLFVTAVDPEVLTSLSTSDPIKFSGNSFVLSEDLNNKISGPNIAVAGRNHDIRVTRASSSSCGTDSDYQGSKSLRIWRTDHEQGSMAWTAPSVVSPAVVVPNARPLAENITLNFTNGVANLHLATSDVGRYSITLEDSSVSSTNPLIGSLGPLTVRPFALVLRNIVHGTTANPNGSSETSAVFAPAGASFSATLGAYRWSNSADGNDDGLPDAGASLSAVTAAGLAPRFSRPVTLAPQVTGFTPSAGLLGGLSGARFSSYVGGEATLSTLAYSEVGSFRLQTADVVTNYLNTSGLNLSLNVFNASGGQNDRVGRFVPHSFDVLLTPTCGLSPTQFSYSGQPVVAEVSARSALASRDITENYDGALAFAKNVALQTTGSVGAGTLANGSVPASAFVDGAALLLGSSRPVYTYSAKLTAPSTLTLRATDSEGITSARGLEQGTPLRSGRLRLFSASGLDRAPLELPLQLHYWSGQAWVPNPHDNCTSLTTASVFQTGKTNASATYSVASVTLSGGGGAVRFNAPTSTSNVTAGSVDVALNLGTSGNSQSCLAAQGGTPAGLPWLRSQNGACAVSYDRDPAAKATFGIYTPETSPQIHVREVH